MRLLDTRTDTIQAPEDQVVQSGTRYAILSHTWGAEEITLSDLKNGGPPTEKVGWSKLEGARKQAALDGYDYLWMDTCCIDKSSTTELSEAMNSMFRFDQNAAICYVYLVDGQPCGRGRLKDEYFPCGKYIDHNSPAAQLCRSRWFSRGWTLPEVIAPSNVVFFDRGWNGFAKLEDIRETVTNMTGIHREVFSENAKESRNCQIRIARFSIAQRMSWAAGRVTTRMEDRAYSLFGLFSVNIDVRYGEGIEAFTRLQEVLIDTIPDESIFAWEYPGATNSPTIPALETLFALTQNSLLAPTPDAFAHCHNIVPFDAVEAFPKLTIRGLHLTCPVTISAIMHENPGWMLLRQKRRNAQIWLRCRYQNDSMTAIMLNVRNFTGNGCRPGASNEQLYDLGRWSWSDSGVGISRSPRLSYVSAIKADEHSSSANIVVRKPQPHYCAATTLALLYKTVQLDVWISMGSSRGYSAPRIESIRPSSEWCPHGEPGLLKPSGGIEERYRRAVISMRYMDGPALQLMFAVKNLPHEMRSLGFLDLDFHEGLRVSLVAEHLSVSSSELGSRDEWWKRIKSISRKDLEGLPIENSLRLDRNLVLVATMKRAHINGEHMVIIQTTVESISRYYLTQLPKMMRSLPKSIVDCFTFLFSYPGHDSLYCSRPGDGITLARQAELRLDIRFSLNVLRSDDSGVRITIEQTNAG